MKRRALLGGLGAAGLAGLAGCLGLVGMDEHESSPAGVESAAREETGYEQTAVEDIVVEEEVGISAYSETVSVTNYKTDHEKEVQIPPIGGQRAAIFTVLTSPTVGIAGRNFNPVEEMSTTELIELVEDNYDEIGDVSHEEDGEIEIVGETTTRSRFSADATFNGHDLEVDIHVTEAVEAGDDLLVTIGVYPQEIRGEEEDNVLSLMEAVDPDAVDEDAGTDGDDSQGGNESDDSDGDGGDSSGGDEDSDSSDGDDGNSSNDSDGDDDGPLGSVE